MKVVVNMYLFLYSDQSNCINIAIYLKHFLRNMDKSQEVQTWLIIHINLDHLNMAFLVPLMNHLIDYGFLILYPHLKFLLLIYLLTD